MVYQEGCNGGTRSGAAASRIRPADGIVIAENVLFIAEGEMTKTVTVCSVFLLAATLLAAAADASHVRKAPFGQTAEGRPVALYTLTGRNGVEAGIMTYGATLVSLKVPDREGRLANVVLGFDTLAPYLQKHPYFGAIVGRYANRIAGGRFTLDGRTTTLPLNGGANTLHGGKGFDKKLWRAKPFANGVTFLYVSADGEEGFPGRLTVRVTYRLRGNALAIAYKATTSKPTVVNLTNHSYFNLSGEPQHGIGENTLMVAADAYTPLDAASIPTGQLLPVAGTRFDFRTPRAIGARVVEADGKSRLADGYDNNWVLTKPKPNALATACVLGDPVSGRELEVLTTEPGLQIFTGYFPGRTGVALETQHFPDSPNQPSFPSTVLRPGETFTSQTLYVFRTAKQGEAAVSGPAR
jgi:aldose 1-epimerase